jgi:tetratricopeptide (TPR) repeat protein
MTGACVFWRLAVMVLAGMAWGIALAVTTHAQGDDALARLRNEVSRLHGQGKYADAVPVAERYVALARQRHGEEHREIGLALNWLGLVYRAQGRYAEAEPLYRRSLAIWEQALGPEHPDVANTLNNLASLYQDQGRYPEAEALQRRSLVIHEKALGPEHPLVALSLNNLAELYRAQGRYAEAEPLHQRSLAIGEKVLGPDHPDVAQSLNNLAELYRAQGRYAETEPLYRRSLAIREKALGPDHPQVATALNNLAALYQAQGRSAETEPLYQRGLAIREKALGPDHPHVAASLNDLAGLYGTQGRSAEAERLYRRSLAISEKALGREHPDVAIVLSNLAFLYRPAEAEPLFRRSLAIGEKALGREHPDLANTLNNLARHHYEQSDWARAANYWRRGTNVIRRRAERGLSGTKEGSSNGEAQQMSWLFSGLAKVTYPLAAPRPTATLAAEMFETAQWALSSDAAASLAQMAARSARNSPRLAGIVRERQDLVSEWQAKDKLLIAAKADEPARRKADAEKALADRLAAIDTRLAEIDRQLAQNFPEYTALASPAPAAVAEIQAQLAADEALVVFLDTPERRPLPEESFIWVVTKTEVRWVRSVVGTEALTREVTALRCGLDDAAWKGAGRERCAKALGIPVPVKAPDPLPFDHARAHKLYATLFGQVQDLINGKHLLIVPSGPLTQLPFQVLVTKPPTSGNHGTAAWLAREHAITVLPAVSSLKALRRIGRPSAAPRPMIGFGNPLLIGYPGSPDDDPEAKALAKDHAEWAKQAREKQRCPETPRRRVAGHHGTKGNGVAHARRAEGW